MSEAGVYTITCTQTGAVYVGSASKSFGTRWNRHRRGLRKGIHHSVNLQRTWDKYGESVFVFKPVIICRETDAILFEQLAIDALQPALNMACTAGNLSGYKHTPQVLQAMRDRRWSPETKLKISQSHRSTEVSADVRAFAPSGRRKLSDTNVVEMRALWASRTETLRGLAKRFGIDHHTAHDICHRKTWRHI